MTDQNKRRHPRLAHRAKLNVFITPQHSVVLQMRDFSDSGLFLLSQGWVPAMGQLLEVQTTEFPDAPVRKVKVVRIEEGVGLGVEFI